MKLIAAWSKIFLICTLLNSVITFADDNDADGSVPTPPSEGREDNGPTDDDFDDFYGGGNDELEVVRFSDDYVHMKIENDMKMACKGDGMCTLFAVSESGSKFTASFNFGWSMGNSGNNGISNGASSGGGIGGGYGGFYGGGGSSAFGSSNGEGGLFFGMNLMYSKHNCTQRVNVPRSLFRSMNTFLYRLINEDGTPRRSFTPADETMIMFYTTIMKQATGCSSGGGMGY